MNLKLQYFGNLMGRTDSFEKNLYAGKDLRQEEKGTTEDETVGWNYQLDGHEFKQAPGVGNGQGSLECCSSWGRNESEKAEFQENIYFCYIDYAKALAVWITTTCGKFLKRWEYQTTLPVS